MLAAIREFFERNLSAGQPPERRKHTLELATATLLVEVARLDGETTAEERDAVVKAVRGRFHLGQAEADELFAIAEAEAKEATDYYQFTSLIRSRYSQEERQEIVEMLWRAAYADEALSAHEQHLVRKIADLLYVPHSAYIAAKLRARDAASG